MCKIGAKAVIYLHQSKDKMAQYLSGISFQRVAVDILESLPKIDSRIKYLIVAIYRIKTRFDTNTNELKFGKDDAMWLCKRRKVAIQNFNVTGKVPTQRLFK